MALEASKEKPKAMERVADANPESYKSKMKEMEGKQSVYNLKFMPTLRDKKAGANNACSLDRIDRF